MTDFENDLRRRLTDAARLAPARRPAVAVRPPRRGQLLVAGLAAAAVAVAAGAIWGAGRDTEPGNRVADPGGSPSVHVDDSALCASLMEFDGRTYAQTGWTRLPRQGPSLGDVQRNACEGHAPRMPAFIAHGFDPSTAVLTPDAIWIAEGVEAPDLEQLTAPVLCTGQGAASARGRVDGVVTTDGNDGNDGNVIGIELTLTEGPAWLMRSDAAVRVTATVRDGDADPYASLARSLQSGDAAVRVQFRCSAGQFVTAGLVLTP